MEKKDQNTDMDKLLVNYLTGEASQAEREVVHRWLGESVENRIYFEELKKIDKTVKISGFADSFDTDRSWQKIKLRHYKELADTAKYNYRADKRMFIRDLFRYAAFIVLAFAIGAIGFHYLDKKMDIKASEVWYTVDSPYGSRVKLTLADGSKVWLNAGSNLRYSSLFGYKNRKVILNGEAFFSVEKDSSKQFIVTTPYLDVKVYGTEFNVKAYSNEDVVQTTLVSGSVTLEGNLVAKIGNQSVTLKPNQIATFYISDKKANDIKHDDREFHKIDPVKNENLVITPNINPVIYTSWKDPLWYIESEPLLSLTEKFERRFNIKFVFTSENLQEYKFTGILKDETLEQVLELMKYSAPIGYTIKNNVVILSENKLFKNSYDEMLIKKNR
jgi:transmembrane sensor